MLLLPPGHSTSPALAGNHGNGPTTTQRRKQSFLPMYPMQRNSVTSQTKRMYKYNSIVLEKCIPPHVFSYVQLQTPASLQAQPTWAPVTIPLPTSNVCGSVLAHTSSMHIILAWFLKPEYDARQQIQSFSAKTTPGVHHEQHLSHHPLNTVGNGMCSIK